MTVSDPQQDSHSDRRSASLLFSYGFGNAAAYVIARTVADSQFLSRIGPTELPKVYLAAAGIVALASAVYGRMVRGKSVRGSVIVTLGILSLTTAVLPFVIDRFPVSPVALTIVYLVAQVRGSLGTIQFTMLLNEQFAQRQPERIVGIVGIGSTLAGFLLGIALGQFTDVSDLTPLLFIVALIDMLTAIPVRMLPPGRKFASVVPNEFFWLQSKNDDQPVSANGNNYPWKLAGMVAVGVLAATLVEYQWKSAVAEHLHRDESALARYFGTFYGCVFLITGVLQFFVTATVLKHRGLLAGLLLFPIGLLASGIGVLTATVGRTLLMTMTVAKGCDALKRSMNDPAIHILYSPLPSQLRHQVVTFVAGIVKPIAEAFASVLLILFATSVTSQQLSIPVIILVVIWIVMDLVVWRGFVAQRGKNLTQPKESGPKP